MATSRYQVGGAGTKPEVDSRSVGTVSSNTTASQANTSNQTQNTSSSQTQTTDSTTKNMSDAQLAQLNAIISTLAGGGTPTMRFNAATRRGEVQTLQDARSGYSKEAAFGDAQGLISQQMRRVLEQLMPSISRAAEDAGSSGGALRALLIQDAANKAAESSSALGVQAAVNYGGVSANLSQVLERLTAGGDPAAELLVQALNAAKGSIQQTNGTVTTTGNQTTNTAGSSTQNSAQTQNQTETKNVDYAPFSSPISMTPQVFGVTDGSPDPSKYVGSTAWNMAELNGGANPWRSYTF